ncbi:MAG: ROK family transcriptional regulator [Clostridia bacterium]|nr:ROK family transcriptional regulator [Clostridia bacterium]
MSMSKQSNKKKQVINLKNVKEYNYSLIFNLIYSNGVISRADLASLSGMSPTTVSALTAEMLEEGLIEEIGTGISATSGRKPILLQIKPDGAFLLGVDIKENKYSCCLFNLKNEIIASKHEKLTEHQDIGKDILNTIDSIILESYIPRERLAGICIGIPGIIDLKRQVMIKSTVMPENISSSFIDQVKKAYTHIPVIIQNASCLYAYAEMHFGAAKGTGNQLFIDINSGIGCAIIINGTMYTGANGIAGEIGHMTIDINGPVCKCSNKGCFEAMASVPAIIQRVIQGILLGRKTLVRDMIGDDLRKININVIRDALTERDSLTCEIIDDISYLTAVGINNVINLLNPQAVIIGGEIQGLGEYFLEKVNSNIEKISLNSELSKIKVSFSNIKEYAVEKGAAKYLLDQVFFSKSETIKMFLEA